MNKTLHVKELWWEGSDLCIETECGQTLRFTGAYASAYDMNIVDGGENMVIEKANFTFDRIDIKRSEK